MKGILLNKTLWLVVVGALIMGSGYLVAQGTAAVFTAQTTNPATFTTGFLTMTNVTADTGTGTDCATATINGSCDSIFTSAEMTNMVPGSSAQGDITITAQMAGLSGLTTKLWANAVTSSDAGASAAVCTTATLPNQFTLQVKGDPAGTNYDVFASAGFNTFPTAEGSAITVGSTSGAGTWSNNTSQVYRFTMTFNLAADSSYQDCSLAVTWIWKISQ